MIRSALSAFFGLVLMVAPGALDYGDPAAAFHYTMGPLLVSFGVIAIWESVRGSRFLNLPLAAAVIIVTPILAFDPAPIAAALVAGIGSGVTAALPNDVQGNYGGGWRVLTRSNDSG